MKPICNAVTEFLCWSIWSNIAFCTPLFFQRMNWDLKQSLEVEGLITLGASCFLHFQRCFIAPGERVRSDFRYSQQHVFQTLTPTPAVTQCIKEICFANIGSTIFRAPQPNSECLHASSSKGVPGSIEGQAHSPRTLFLLALHLV